MSDCPRCGAPITQGEVHTCRAMQATNAERPRARSTPPPVDADPFVGKLLGGQYLVLEKIGAGGMGTVYLVEHVQLKKQFAAKVLISELARQPEAIARFELEAVAASRLDHDNIVNVVNFGRSDDGTVFLVMERLRGEPLNRAIARGPLAFDDAVRVAAQICDALDAAHRADIVHRDLKPENVFVARRSGGRTVVKLLDFGISKIKEAGLAVGRLTQAGEILGSPLYMSPEAALAELELDARADLYAVGVMLYEMVTGEVPFNASNLLVVLHLHLAEPPRPPRELRPDLPPELERVILRALEKDRSARYQTADELEADLIAAFPTDLDAPLGFVTDAADGEGSPTPGPSSRRRSLDRAPRATPRPPTNLAAPTNRFIGRPREVAEVTRLVREARLVTLTGTGGAGKTRLAAEVAERVLRDYPHGVWFVELAGLRDGALLDDTVARVLGFEARTAAGARETLVAALADQRALIVLDNCEHLITAGAALAEALLRACPGLHVLATSREPLGIAGETIYRVPPLSMPDPDRVHGPADLGGSDAVQLFVERARAASPGFEVTAGNAAAVARVCVRLDGIPLALELAAARLRNLSVEELQARLGDSFRILTGGSRTALPRQQTLRALIDWSHDLLDERQRLGLRRLAVFAGGFTLAQAEAVIAGDGLDPLDVLDRLCELVDRSLVVAEPRGATTRYRLLETIRQYARERLDEAREVDPLRRRHHDELLRWTEAMCARYADSPEDAAWFDQLTVEHDNLREAIRSGLELDVPATHRFVPALRKFWLVRGHYVEARGLVAPLLERQPRPDEARMLLLDAANLFATMQLDYAAAAGHANEALVIARQLGERVRESTLRTHLGYLQLLQCNFAEADRLATEALAFARQGPASFPLYFALNIAGLVASRVHDHARAIALLDECRAATLQSGGRQYHANVLESLATAYALRDGQYELAIPLYREAAAIFTAVGDPGGELVVCERMAQVAVARGQLRDAARFLGATAVARQRLGMPREPIDELDQAPVLAAIEGGLSVEERAAADAEGRGLAFDDALALALTMT